MGKNPHTFGDQQCQSVLGDSKGDTQEGRTGFSLLGDNTEFSQHIISQTFKNGVRDLWFPVWQIRSLDGNNPILNNKKKTNLKSVTLLRSIKELRSQGKPLSPKLETDRRVAILKHAHNILLLTSPVLKRLFH